MRILLIVLAIYNLTACATLRNENQERANLYLQLGTSQLQNEDYPNALKSLLEAEKLDDTNAIVQNNLGLTYFMRERYDLSQKHFLKAITLNPNYSDARSNLARTYIEVLKFAEAEKELSIVLNDLTYSGFGKAHINLGLSKFNQKQYQAAAKNFAKAIEIDPENCPANSYYGRSLFELKDYEKATRALDRAISYCQKQLYDEPHYFSAVAYYRLGEKEKSVARFQEVLKIYPNGIYRDKARGMLDLIRKGAQ